MQKWVYLYLVPLLLNRIGNFLAYVTTLFVTSVCRLLSLLAEYIVRETQNLLIAVGRKFVTYR